MKLSETQKNRLSKVFFFGMIEVICSTFYITISILSGHIYWSVEQLTTTPMGMVIQILSLIILIDGIIISIYLVIFVIKLIKS